MLLLEVLNVWDENEENVEWEEMAQVGVRILLAFISRPETEYCATASSKLSKLLKVRINTSQGELCYTLGRLHQAFVTSREKGIELHSWSLHASDTGISYGLMGHLARRQTHPYCFFNDMICSFFCSRLSQLHLHRSCCSRVASQIPPYPTADHLHAYILRR